MQMSSVPFILTRTMADTDWIDEISRTPVSHVHNLSLMGGNFKD